MMRRLTSAPKPVAARRSYITRRSSRLGRAYAVAHAVVAREVRARLRRGNQVVDGDAMTAVRQRRRRRSAAPCASSTSSASSNAARTPASTPSLISARGTPMRRPRSRRSTLRLRSRHGRGHRRRVTRVVSGDDAEAPARRLRPSRRTGRSDRATTRTRSGRSETRARRSASSRPRRTTPRAGGSIRPCPSRARAARGRRRPPPRIRRSSRRECGRDAHGLRVTPYAEFSVDEPIANSSQLVLPTMTAPAASRRSTTVAL